MGKEKTALVLSAGGMFGAYQAGAWKTIAEEIQPDIVVGASAGALNGYQIAGGSPPDELIRKWLDPRSGEALRLVPNAGWKNGWFDPAALRAQTERIVAEFVPRIPFALVLVQLPWLRTVAVKAPHITAAHLQATCSIPVFLPAVKIEGQRFTDGGLLEKLPLWTAVEMGATRIIAVDSLPQTRIWWLRAGTNTVRLFRPRHKYPPNLDVTIVSPSEYLGESRDGVFWKKENAERWIELGKRDAAMALRGRAAKVA
jgi:NTE family protein